ncbi:hypothetical protein K3495_g486 [Podosphaera aphanis]|nr:hypothetical protein K3495_g486 [Podosphaera aphanis]
MENDALINDAFIDDPHIRNVRGRRSSSSSTIIVAWVFPVDAKALRTRNLSGGIVVSTRANDVFAPEMLVQSYITILSLLKLLSFPPITNPIVQQELPPLEGLNQFLLPQIFSLPITPVIQQELPFLQGQNPIFVPESPLPFPDKTLEFSEMQS